MQDSLEQGNARAPFLLEVESCPMDLSEDRFFICFGLLWNNFKTKLSQWGGSVFLFPPPRPASAFKLVPQSGSKRLSWSSTLFLTYL
jgi:hypothetical protein